MPKPRTNAGWIVAMLLVIALPAGYMGAYYWLANPQARPMSGEAAYRVEGEHWKWLFAPGHELDRWLWPDRWSPWR